MRLPKRFAFVIVLTFSLGSGAARADVVAVVSSRSPITSLSKQQVADIFLGKTARFPDGTPAVPIDQAEGTGPRDEFYLQFTGKSAAQVKAHWSKIIFTGRGQPPKVVMDSAEIVKLLASTPNGIGYVEERMVDDSLKVVLQRVD